MISTFRTSDFQISGSAISSHKNIQYGVAKENGEWYVDMVGEWEDEEVGDRFQIGWYCLFFMATIVSISIGWLRIEEEKKEERKRIIIRRRVKF